MSFLHPSRPLSPLVISARVGLVEEVGTDTPLTLTWPYHDLQEETSGPVASCTRRKMKQASGRNSEPSGDASGSGGSEANNSVDNHVMQRGVIGSA